MTAHCWQMWSGLTHGKPPASEAIVDLVAVNGTQMRTTAGFVDWALTGDPTDVMFFRVVSAAPVEAAILTAPAILNKASKIMEERGKQYDQPNGERSMGKAVSAFNIITGNSLQESEGWLLMQILKDVRDRQKKEAHVDSLEDCVAYSALKAESRLAGK